MCDICRTLKLNEKDSVVIKNECFQTRPYPVTELELICGLELQRQDGYVLAVAANSEVQVKKHQKSADVQFKIPIQYCPFCGEKLN